MDRSRVYGAGGRADWTLGANPVRGALPAHRPWRRAYRGGVGDVKPAVVSLSDEVWERTRARVEGLTDEEYFWEPAPGCWSIRRRRDGTWAADGVFPVHAAGTVHHHRLAAVAPHRHVRRGPGAPLARRPAPGPGHRPGRSHGCAASDRVGRPGAPRASARPMGRPPPPGHRGAARRADRIRRRELRGPAAVVLRAAHARRVHPPRRRDRPPARPVAVAAGTHQRRCARRTGHPR